MASKENYETKDDRRILYSNPLQDLIHKPIDIVFSTTAVRAYLTTFLVISSGLVLFGFAVLAYALFYWSYIPRIGFERTIHLQFDNVYHTSDSRHDHAGNPYGIVVLAPDLVSLQKYDVAIEIALPRTPENRDVGNFMLEATMYAAGTVVDPLEKSLGAAADSNRLARSRRPAIMPYRSIVVEYLYRLTELHWYILGFRSEADKMKIVMWEDVEFTRGWRNVPSTMRLEIQSTSRMQIYSATALFKARFTALRWLMYNHRIMSAAVFITGFWATEVVFAGIVWAALTFYLQQPQQVKSRPVVEDGKAVKEEDDEDTKPQLSDTERTFPTTSRQAPLRYQSPRVKQEEGDDTVIIPEAVTRAIEADDEDEDADVFLDSGIGTSMESSVTRSESVRKRRSRARLENNSAE